MGHKAGSGRRIAPWVGLDRPVSLHPGLTRGLVPCDRTVESSPPQPRKGAVSRAVAAEQIATLAELRPSFVRLRTSDVEE
jgi:hypothetical protein